MSRGGAPCFASVVDRRGGPRLASCTWVQAYRSHMETMTSEPGNLGWADARACTLPTAQRPLRLAEFDELFASALRSIQRTGVMCARFELWGDPGLAERTRDLAEAESSCCPFFTFEVTVLEAGQVAFDVEVPPAYTDVLDGLVAHAEIALGGES